MSKIASRRAGHLRRPSTTRPLPAARIKLQFRGNLSELMDLVLLTGDDGEWQEKPNGIWRYRSADGGGLNWSSTRGTVWCDGPPKPRARLERLIETCLKSEQTS
jgi:hypothetical protein